MKPVLIVLLLSSLAGCVTASRPSLDAMKPLEEKQRDVVECQALAAQAATGTGEWSSDRAVRSALYTNARDQYLALCLQSRGWRWVDSRQNLGSTLTTEEQQRVCQSYLSETNRQQCFDTLRRAR
jgi:hypothetical protein